MTFGTSTTSTGHMRTARGFLWVAVLFGSACSRVPDAPVDDGQKIVRATLQILASDGKALCVDRQTSGRPLAIYAAMRVAPSPSRRPLKWHVPQPLVPPGKLSNAQLYRDSLGSETAHLQDPGTAGATLSGIEQGKLDASATALAARPAMPAVTVSSRWVPGVEARWWLLNRVSRSCSPIYTLSDPVWSDSLGYVTVLTEHWGTTYAFSRTSVGWKPVGQWTNWLY